MQIGIFAKTFARPTLGETLGAVRAHGLSQVQFNLSCAGLPTLPDSIDPEFADAVHQEAQRQGIRFAAISGTFNMIDPDVQKRNTGLQRLGVLASVCKQLQVSVITLCTGSRDPESMRGQEIFPEITRLIQGHGAQQGLAIFLQSDIYQAVLRESPAAAASLAKQFESPRAGEVAVRLERMPRDAPNRDKQEWKQIRVPTLVLANRQDPIHPFEYGTTLAAHIPGAEFREITAKSVSLQRHTGDTQREIADFLTRHFS